LGSILALNGPKALLVVLEHDLHRAQDRGGLGLKLAQASGNLPESGDPSTAQANSGNEGGGVHWQRVYVDAD